MNGLVGDRPLLWKSHREVALVLWVSMLSPLEGIDIYRRTLLEMLELSPPIFCVSSTLNVKALCALSPPLPIGAIYVGSGYFSFPLEPSVWLNPCNYFSFVSSLLDVYYQTVLLHPDFRNWLRPNAQASVLVSDCLSDV